MVKVSGELGKLAFDGETRAKTRFIGIRMLRRKLHDGWVYRKTGTA
jgi:hypothetical protein